MKSKLRLISKFYNGIYIVTILLMVSAHFVPGMEGLGIILCDISIAGICFMSFVFPSGVYKYDEEGITFYTNLKKYYHKWSEFKYVNLFRMTNEVVGGEKRNFTYWVQFSNIPPIVLEDLSAGRGFANLDKYACFQYRIGMNEELCAALPEPLKSQWIEIEKNELSELRLWEKLYNR